MGFMFEGAYFEYDIPLHNDETMAAHFVHSCLHLRDSQNKLHTQPGMSVSELYEANEEFFRSLVDLFYRKRAYRITTHAVNTAMFWFLFGYKKK